LLVVLFPLKLFYILTKKSKKSVLSVGDKIN
jgi:hypothetical protein